MKITKKKWKARKVKNTSMKKPPTHKHFRNIFSSSHLNRFFIWIFVIIFELIFVFQNVYKKINNNNKTQR